MRTIFILGILAFAIFAVCETKSCNSADDCEDDECCSSQLWKNVCKKLKKEGEMCVENVEELKNGDKYKFTCPCAEGLECKNVKSKDENGIVNFFKNKCVAA